MIKINNENEWQIIKEWLNASLFPSEPTCRAALLKKPIERCRSRAFIALGRDLTTGHLTLAVRQISWLGRIWRKVFGRYSRYANTILLPAQRKRLVQLIHSSFEEEKKELLFVEPNRSRRDSSLFQKEESQEKEEKGVEPTSPVLMPIVPSPIQQIPSLSTKQIFSQFASNYLLPRHPQERAFLGFIHEKRDARNGQVFLAVRMIHPYIFGEERGIENKPPFLTQEIWDQVVALRERWGSLSPPDFQEVCRGLDTMIHTESSLVLFGDNKELSHVFDEEFDDQTREAFFALKRVGKLVCQEEGFRAFLTTVLPEMIAQRVEEQGGYEGIKADYQYIESYGLNLVTQSKEEREYAVGDDPLRGFCSWVDRSILPSYLNREIFDFLIREKDSEKAQLLAAMRVIYHVVFGNERSSDVRPIHLSRKLWKKISQLRAEYQTIPLEIPRLNQLMCSKQLIVLCGEGDAAREAEEKLNGPLRQAFCDLKRTAQESVATHRPLLNRIIGTAATRLAGNSATTAGITFKEFLFHAFPLGINRLLLDFVLEQDSGAFLFLPTLAAYHYVFEEPFKHVKDQPSFLKDETWRAIEALRTHYTEHPLQHLFQLKELMKSADIIWLFETDAAREKQIEESLPLEIRKAFQELRAVGGNEVHSISQTSLLSAARMAKIKKKIEEINEGVQRGLPRSRYIIVGSSEGYLYHDHNHFND